MPLRARQAFVCVPATLPPEKNKKRTMRISDTDFHYRRSVWHCEFSCRLPCKAGDPASTEANDASTAQQDRKTLAF